MCGLVQDSESLDREFGGLKVPVFKKKGIFYYPRCQFGQ